MDNELGEGSGLLLQGSSSGVDFGDGLPGQGKKALDVM